MVGIVSYGFYIPKYRIRIEDIANVWGKNPADIEHSLNIKEKAVASVDEDSLTMAFAASKLALSDVNVPYENIKVVLLGSETPSYAVNPTSTILGEFLGIPHNYLAYDTQFACKAGTGALISAVGLVKSNFTTHALVCAADKATAKTHDALEYTAASGAVSLLVGSDDVALEIIDMESYSSDTPDFWRRDGIRYPSHGGRFTGKPAYLHHIQSTAQIILARNNMQSSDFAQAVFHMPNGRFPLEVGKVLGFEYKQVEHSLVVPYLGNSYTASALMGLVSALEHAKDGDLIFFASYGSGAGSDAFIFKVTKNLEKRRREFAKLIQDKQYITYPTYLKFMNLV